MLFCYPHGITQIPNFERDRSDLAEDLIAQEMIRERGVLECRLRRAGISFHSAMDTNELVKLIARFSVH
jgi:hypothetical protein